MPDYWSRGDTVIVRYGLYEQMTRAYRALRDDPVNVAGWPYVVLQDNDAGAVLFLPEGTLLWRWDVETGRFRPPRVTQGDSVRLLFPGKRYDVSLFYDTGSGPAPWVSYYFPGEPGPFYGWKVDIVTPFLRRPWGFDVIDDVLDIAVRPDRAHRILDEEALSELTRRGVYSHNEAAVLLNVADDVVQLIESAEPPFDDSWISWRPPIDLKVGNTPHGWESAPPYAT